MLVPKLRKKMHLLQLKLTRGLRRLTESRRVRVFKKIDDYDSHIVDDLPLTIVREPFPGASASHP